MTAEKFKRKLTAILSADVVNFFDVIDPGDPSVPPRFRCEKCGGVMLAV